MKLRNSFRGCSLTLQPMSAEASFQSPDRDNREIYMFLSIFAATCRPNNVLGFLDNLAQTADDTSSFEVLLKLDEGADDLIALIENYKKTARFTIKYLATPVLEGYYSLDIGYNELLKIADPDTYFCWLLTDEIRFEKK